VSGGRRNKLRAYSLYKTRHDCVNRVMNVWTVSWLCELCHDCDYTITK